MTHKAVFLLCLLTFVHAKDLGDTLARGSDVNSEVRSSIQIPDSGDPISTSAKKPSQAHNLSKSKDVRHSEPEELNYILRDASTSELLPPIILVDAYHAETSSSSVPST